jgi:xanthosine utilization system XapX-like protein
MNIIIAVIAVSLMAGVLLGIIYGLVAIVRAADQMFDMVDNIGNVNDYDDDYGY